MAARRHICTDFYRGHHREVVRQTVDSPTARISPEEIPEVVGALCFLGRFEEAESFFRLNEASLEPDSLVAARFFLGVGFCRHAHYPKAFAFFADNLRARPRPFDARSRFFVCQGAGFYHYFSGRLRSALHDSQTSFDAALESRFLYGKALAADLKGHCLIQTGQVLAGMRTLDQAEALASSLGADWLREAIQVSQLTYRARYGLQPETVVASLRKKIAQHSQQDSYSQATLLLELGQQLLLRGKLAEAKEALNACCGNVYASQNRRQESLLNLRYAYAQYFTGDAYQALNLVRNTLKQLDLRVDRQLQVKALGMELVLSRALGMSQRADQVEAQIRVLTRGVGHGVSYRILRRKSGEGDALPPLAEDRIGDLKDEIARRGEAALDSILRSGYFAFLYDVLQVRPGESLLYFDLVPGSLTVFDQGAVEFVPEGITPTLRALGKRLAAGAASKKQLIEDLWGYEYHPLRHDSLIYSAVLKLRRMLGERGFWIEAAEEGYRLKPQLRMLFREAIAVASPVPETPAAPPGGPSVSGLNHRQLRILRYLARNEFIDAATCTKLFRVSEITATRDLSALTRRRLVERLGRARATKYRGASESFTSGAAGE